MIFLAFILPLAIYLLVLSVLNRSNHPVMVGGIWDFVGVLFAASGFLLVGGPAILSGLHEQWRLSWVLGQTRFLNEVGEDWYFWISLWGLYLGAVVAGAILLIRRRRNQTSIYNIDLAVLERLLFQVCDRLGLEGRRGESRRILLRYRESDAPSDYARLMTPRGYAGRTDDKSGPILAEQQFRRSVLAEEQPRHYLAGLDVEWFPAMRHVTLHWAGASDGFRQEIESELAKSLSEVHTHPNPASSWFLSLAIGLLLIVFAGLSVTAVVWVRLMAR